MLNNWDDWVVLAQTVDSNDTVKAMRHTRAQQKQSEADVECRIKEIKKATQNNTETHSMFYVDAPFDFI